MAAGSDTVARGIFLLAIYSAGLAIPFLLTALAINRFLRFYKRFRRHLHVVEVGSGVRTNLLGVEHELGFGCPLHERELWSGHAESARA